AESEAVAQRVDGLENSHGLAGARRRHQVEQEGFLFLELASQALRDPLVVGVNLFFDFAQPDGYAHRTSMFSITCSRPATNSNPHSPQSGQCGCPNSSRFTSKEQE